MPQSPQQENKKPAPALAWAAQGLLLVFTVWAVLHMFLYSGSGNMRVDRFVIFRYFTTDSNILCAASSAFWLAQRLRGREGSLAATLFRYAGTAAVTVTMMTVLLFLGPVYGYPAMFDGWNLWLHLLGPALAIFSFVWLERDGAAPQKGHLGLALLPVIAYGVVYYIQVILVGEAAGGWPDFYGFNRGGMWYVSYAVMMAATALIGLALRRLRKGGLWRSLAHSRRKPLPKE